VLNRGFVEKYLQKDSPASYTPALFFGASLKLKKHPKKLFSKPSAMRVYFFYK